MAGGRLAAIDGGLTASHSDGMGGEVVYRKSWFGTVKVLVFYLALLAMIVAWRPYSGLPDHLLLGGSSLSLLLLMLAQLTGSPHSVALTERGLEFRRWRKRSFVSWEDVAEVRVVRWVGKSGTLRPVSQAQLVSPEGATRRLHFVCTLAESAHGPSSALWRPATLPF
jgi:hypothetical protein